MKRQKKSDNRTKALENTVLITAILNLIRALIELINRLIE